MNKVLIVGYGSIGRKHALILKKKKLFSKIFVYSNQKNVHFKKINSFKEILKLNPSYLVVSKPTSEHFKFLKFFERNFSKKKILIEKPLFDKKNNFLVKKNLVYIGYNLRFHPVIKYLKKILNKKSIFNVSIFNTSYLPNWRKNIKYHESNSALKRYGGGVLLELSHELDLIRYLFGKYKIKYALNKKISNLKINSDDNLVLNANIKNTNRDINLNLISNFFSKFNQRKIICDYKNGTIMADLLNNKITIFENKKKTIEFRKKFTMENTYYEMHKAILNNKNDCLCNYSEGLKVMSDIENIKNKK